MEQTIHTICPQISLPSLEKELLLAHVLKKDRTWIIAHPETTLSDNQTVQFQSLVERRKNHEPIAYIINEKEFYGRPFYVDERVLIPRPATEALIDEVKFLFENDFEIDSPRITDADTDVVICTQLNPTLFARPSEARRRRRERSRTPSQLVTSHKARGSSLEESAAESRSNLTIIDLGTGSGCIAITLALEIPDVQIIATDISDDALNVAKLNAEKYEVTDRITFTNDDILNNEQRINELTNNVQRKSPKKPNAPNRPNSPKKPNAPNRPNSPFLIVSNPPYIPEQKKLMPDVSDFEPHKALFSGDDGMDVIKQIKNIAISSENCLGFVIECRLVQATSHLPLSE